MASAITNAISNWFAKLARSRIVLEHPDDPEDERVLHLFKNRAEMKKALGDAQDQVHRLKDRVKLQEAATARVREYSITRFWLKNPNVCFDGVAVNPIRCASKYSNTSRHRLYMERWHSSVMMISKNSIGMRAL